MFIPATLPLTVLCLERTRPNKNLKTERETDTDRQGGDEEEDDEVSKVQ